MYLPYRDGKYIANGQDTTKKVTLVVRISYFTTCSIPAVKDMAEKKRGHPFGHWISTFISGNPFLERRTIVSFGAVHSLQPVHPPVERTCTFLRSLIKRDKDERYDSDLERSLHPRTHLLSSRFLRAAHSKAAK